jgi:transcriptional regulator with XRE-family HTH domain
MTHPLAGLRTIRLALGIHPKTLADRIGITISTYHRYERGERRIYLDKAIVLASTLGLPTTDHLSREPTPDEHLALLQRGAEHRRLVGVLGDEPELIAQLEDWTDESTLTD